jgi:hypothetical protein
MYIRNSSANFFVICVIGDIQGITEGKKYLVIEYDEDDGKDSVNTNIPSWYHIESDDFGSDNWFKEIHFIKIDEFRNMQLDKILEGDV